jgi:uncharacterized protein YndB with AHSA1/START domain
MKDPDIKSDLIAHASVVIKASANEVWRGLTDPEAIKKYMFGATVASGWKEGDSILWKGEWKGKSFEDKGRVLRSEPNHLLQYTHYSPLSGADDVPSNYHTVTIALTSEDEGVWVALTQDKNETDQARQHSEKNWRMMLEGLKKYVEAASASKGPLSP